MEVALPLTEGFWQHSPLFRFRSWNTCTRCVSCYALIVGILILPSELLPTHGPSPPRCNSLLWLNVQLAGDWGWRHWEPFYLPYHEPPLVVEWQRHTYSFLLDTKPLWHRRKWKSWPAGEGDHWPWHRSSGGCPLCRFETTCQLLHPAAGSNQVGCSCTWQRSLFRETNTGATEEIPALNQSWRGCNHPTSNRPYKGHQVPYLVPRTADWLSPLWSNIDHWPYAPGVCRVTGMSWWILHSWLIEYPLRDNSRDLHSGIPARSGILLSDMTLQLAPRPGQLSLSNLFRELKQLWDTFTCVGRLICPEEHVVVKQIQSNPAAFCAFRPIRFIWRIISNVIIWHGLSVLVQVMVCCLVATEVLWHSPAGNFTENCQNIYPWFELE